MILVGGYMGLTGLLDVLIFGLNPDFASQVVQSVVSLAAGVALLVFGIRKARNKK
jgi:sulfite exporter TauE/SafE